MKTNNITEEQNNLILSYSDCMLLLNSNISFEKMSNNNLDSIYYAAFENYAYHMSRKGYINMLNKKRIELEKNFINQ